TGVVVIMQGTRQVLDVKISKDLLEDIEILQEAILLAVNDALAQIENKTQETMGKYANPGIGF
ncbi:MAG: YbaB/EbfC family nucleoid-associated protein, partial [Acholeplasmataceae bacterium]|nr:YbaB/EbfC family nucleoid-associated protein [Acholeplasmataceae bacterium]